MNDLEKARLLFEEFSPFTKIKDVVQHGDVELLEKFLANNPEMTLDVTDSAGKNLLYFAIISGNTSNAKYLLDNNAELAQLKTEENKTLLHIAAIQNNTEIVSMLLQNKYINKNTQDNNGSTVLHDAVLFAEPEILEKLLKANIDHNILNNNGESILITALNIHNKLNAYNNEIKVKIRRNIKKLVDYGMDFNQLTANGKTPLIEAIETNAVEVIKLAVALKTDLNVKDENGNTALHCAAENMNVNVIKLFVSNGGDVNAQNNKGLTVPMIMAKNGFMNKDFMNYYLDRNTGYKINTQDNDGNTLLHHCAMRKQLDGQALEILVQSGAKMVIKNNAGNQASFVAIKENKDAFVCLEKDYLNEILPLSPTIALKQKVYQGVI